MSGGSLRNLIICPWLDGMDEIRELNSVLDEENGNIVSNNVEIAFVSIESDSKSVDISNRIS